MPEAAVPRGGGRAASGATRGARRTRPCSSVSWSGSTTCPVTSTTTARTSGCAAGSPTFDRAAGVPLNRCYYLATAPEFFAIIVRRLGDHGLDHHPSAAVRVVIEKPFGRDLEDARRLNRAVLSVFAESQVFRIDHYLGKETVQNLLALRFANELFEPIWNRNHISHVQITAAEDIGIEGRAGYYDATGALRDLVQNHLLQLLCHVAMEPPIEFTADEVRDEKAKVLRAIEPPAPDDVPRVAVRAQYAAGTVGGETVPGYLEEEGVPPDSTTETYAAVRLEVHNWRWAGVPFYLRTGKRLARKLTEIAVTLKPVPHLGFAGEGSNGVRPNQLVLVIQPDEGVALSLVAKVPGTRMRLRPVHMDFLYGTTFLSQSPEAYERLDPGRHARRRDAVHPRRRGRGPVAHLRSGRAALGSHARAASRISGRVAGPRRGRLDPASGRRVAPDLRPPCRSRATWSGAPTARRPRRSRPCCARC